MNRRARGSEADLRRTARRIGLQTAGLLMACLVVVVAVLYASVVRSQDEQMTRSLTDAVRLREAESRRAFAGDAQYIAASSKSIQPGRHHELRPAPRAPSLDLPA